VLICRENPVRVLKQVLRKRVQVGGQEHSGWLPKSAALPLAMPLKPGLVDVRILEDVEGFILEFEFQHSSQANDSWHATLQEAEHEAKIQFGIESSEWCPLHDDDI
jgi:hypothetical protein